MKKEENKSLQNNLNEIITTTTYTKENEDGSTTEITTTLSKKTKINYNQITEKNTVVFKTDENDTRYSNILESKKDFAIVLEKNGHKPITFISNKTLLKILNFLNKYFQNGFDEITYAIYSVNEIWEIHNSVTKLLKRKPNDYKFEYQRNIKLHLPEDEKWIRLEMCDDVLELVNNELTRIKDQNKTDKLNNVNKTEQNSTHILDLQYEDEIIEENENKIRKKRKYLKDSEIVKEEIIEEEKLKSCTEKLSEIKQETITKEVPPLEYVIHNNKQDENQPQIEKLDNDIIKPTKPKQNKVDRENTQQIQQNEQQNLNKIEKNDSFKMNDNKPPLSSVESVISTVNQVKTLKDFFEKNNDKNRTDKRKRTYIQKPSKELDINLRDKLTPIPKNIPLTQVPTEFLEPLDWNLYSNEKEIETVQNDPISSFCYCPTLNNGKPAIVTGHNSGNIYAWDIETNKKIKSYSEHKAKVWDVKKIYFTSKLRQIFATISEDSFLKIWDSSSPFKSAISIQYKIPLTVLDIHPSNYIIFADRDKTLYCQKIDFGRKGELIKEDKFKGPSTHNNEINRMCILDQGSIHNTYLVTGSINVMQIHKVDFIKRKFILHQEHPQAHQGLIYDILDITNMQFLTCATDYLIKVWDITQEAPIRVIDSICNDTIYSLMNVFVADAFICGTADNKMKIINKKKILSTDENGYKPTILYEYDRKEPLYKMIYLPDNDAYSIASINNGCSNKVYMWGNTTKPNKKEK